jgi:energy-coupling factor transporter ATP-binding protein EcfA2
MTEPTLALAGLGVAGLSPSLAIVSLRSRDAARWSSGLDAYRLRISGDLAIAEIEQFLAGLSGIRASGWRRHVEIRALGFSITSTEHGIVHRLLLDPNQSGVVLAHLQGALSNVTAVPDSEYVVEVPSLAGELVTSPHDSQLKVDTSGGTSNAILAALQPLGAGETMVVQIIVTPLGSHAPKQPWSWWSTSTEPSKATASKSVQAKYSRPLFSVNLRLGVSSPSGARDRQLLARLTGAFHAANSPEATLRRLRRPSSATARSMARTRIGGGSRCHVNSAELSGLLALPVAGANFPGLSIGGCRPQAPDSEAPGEGRVMAVSNYPSTVGRPLATSVEDGCKHLLLLGPTGSGKSTVILNLVVQDMEAGRGCIVVDPKSDLIEEIVRRVPPHRADDVVILDPTDDDRPVGINLLADGGDAPDLVAEQVLGTFHRLYASSWGPRTDDILRAALLTLVGVPGMTLAEVPLLLTDAAFRRTVVGHIDDPIGLGPFWTAFDALSDAERAQQTGPVLNKLRSVLVRPRLRNVLGQAQPLLDFDDVLSSGKILLVPLAKGLLGEDAAALVGSLLIARLWQAVQRRAGLPPSSRRPVFCYIDEFQDFLNLPTPIPDLLAQARALGLGLTLANQNFGQLTTDVREAVLANARSRVIFQPSASDARRLAQETAPRLTAQDLMGLGSREVVATLSVGARVAPAATGITRPAPPTLSDGTEIRELSRQRYGRDRTAIEAEMRRRHEGPTGQGPVGRQRRKPR